MPHLNQILVTALVVVRGPGSWGNKEKDSDYLAGGAWMLIPDSGKAEDFWTGVFADGGNLFQAGISRHLSGEVTYEGKALGKQCKTQSQQLRRLEAANFFI